MVARAGVGDARLLGPAAALGEASRLALVVRVGEDGDEALLELEERGESAAVVLVVGLRVGERGRGAVGAADDDRRGLGRVAVVVVIAGGGVLGGDGLEDAAGRCGA